MTRRSVWYIFLVSSLFIADRVSKWWVISSGKFYTLNRGISFSLFASHETVQFILISVLVACVILFLAYYTYTRYQQGFGISTELLVLTGAVSNMIDRFWYGGVVDFIELSYQNWTWPAFNIADCCIVVGLVLIGLRNFYER